MSVIDALARKPRCLSLPLSLPLPPAPTRVVSVLDPLVPVAFKQRLVEPLLNRVFSEPLSDGEFDALEGLAQGRPGELLTALERLARRTT